MEMVKERKMKKGLGIILMMCLVSPVMAHEHRDVAGMFKFTVGFVKEPAFLGETNGVDLKVETLKGGKAVEGVEQSLEVIVSKEGENREVKLPFQTRYKEPGRYAAYFLPTQAGSYIFVLKGTIYGVSIDETFASSKGKFSDVQEPVRIP
jgi:hypothetical protein